MLGLLCYYHLLVAGLNGIPIRDEFGSMWLEGAAGSSEGFLNLEREKNVSSRIR